VYRQMGISSSGRMVRGMSGGSPVTSPVLQWDREESLFRVVAMPTEADGAGMRTQQRIRRSVAVSSGLSEMSGRRMPK